MMEKVFVHIRDDKLVLLCFEELSEEELDREAWISERPFYWELESFVENWVGEGEEE